MPPANDSTARSSIEIGEMQPSEALTLVRAKPEDAAAWDAFVDRHSEGRFCQLWGFRQVLEQAYGYRCSYFILRAGSECVGVVPSIVLRRGRGRMISQPFQEYGGPLILPLSRAQHLKLAELLLDVAGEESCESLEIRGGVGCEGLTESPLCMRKTLQSYAVLELGMKEDLWRKSLTNEARKGVNRAYKAGLSIEIQRGIRAVQSPFYDLYLDSMKRLGVPPHSDTFFEVQARALGDRLVACWVRQGEHPAAVLLGVISGQRIQIYTTASLPAFYNARPNDLAHWELICWATASGLRYFDFGSARYQGQIQFKKKWGVSLHDYHCYLISNLTSLSRARVQTVDSSSQFITKASEIWKSVAPLRLTRMLGPHIRKYLTK